MLAKQRQAAILDRVRAQGGARVGELVAQFAVSDMTIRRDLNVLAAEGLLFKVHGGATLAMPSSVDEPGFAAKSSLQPDEKQMIAEAAASLVQPGTAIAIGAGTTTWALARAIGSVPDLTVVTNSIPVADELARGSGGATVILTGGIRTPSDALVGPVADLTIRSLHFDTLFTGCHGMDPHAGLTAPNLAESETNRCLIQAARSVVLLADHTKWGNIGLSSFGQLSDVDALVTDNDYPGTELQQLSEVVGEVIRSGEAHDG
ncbi:MAG: DeoR/GlpR family DNA-binding transcription regulator [Actinomycetia bacterium]|nr:DeoR/GlpR family DNA-binding transcription regulator [Actinomycetes bacterium]